MALLVKTHITVNGEELRDFSHLVIHQTLFGHHHFSLHVPFDVFESSTSTFLVQAHKKLCGQKITISFSSEGKTSAPSGARRSRISTFSSLVSSRSWRWATRATSPALFTCRVTVPRS